MSNRVVFKKALEDVSRTNLGDVVGGDVDACEAVVDLEKLPKSGGTPVSNVFSFIKINIINNKLFIIIYLFILLEREAKGSLSSMTRLTRLTETMS